jgi:hypothetical protein
MLTLTKFPWNFSKIGVVLHGFLIFAKITEKTIQKYADFCEISWNFWLGQQFSQKSQEFRENVHSQLLLPFSANSFYGNVKKLHETVYFPGYGGYF